MHEIKCNVKYLYYILKANWKKHTLKNEVGSATNYIKLAHITDFKIPSLDLNQQKKIAKTLDKVSELIELRKESITKLDALAKSIFIDMFGDPVSNPKGWRIGKLENLVEKEKNSSKTNIDLFAYYIELSDYEKLSDKDKSLLLRDSTTFKETESNTYDGSNIKVVFTEPLADYKKQPVI